MVAAGREETKGEGREGQGARVGGRRDKAVDFGIIIIWEVFVRENFFSMPLLRVFRDSFVTCPLAQLDRHPRSPPPPAMATIAPSDDPTVSSPYAPAMLIGPLVPTCLSMVTIVVAQNIQLTDKTCAASDGSGLENGGCQFLSGATACAYLQLLVFSWVFLGTKVQISFAGKQFTVMRPFSRIRTIGILYFIIFLISLPIFGLAIPWLLGE
jgi:hypothetical protein